MAVRQLRAALVGTGALTAVVVLVLVVHGTVARSVGARYATDCAVAATPSCDELLYRLGSMFDFVARYLGYTTVTCVLIAAVWGAPMISREIENGTAALAWCQSVTRRQWFTARLTVSVVAVTVLGLVLGFAVTWWAASFPTLEAAGRSTAGVVTVSGPLLAAEWLAGLTIGIAIGAVVRRTLPAAAVTAVIVFAATITLNIAGSSEGVSSDAARVLASQLEQSVPVLAVAAIAALVAFRRLDRLRV